MKYVNKQNHIFEVIKNVWYNPNFLRYLGLTIFMIGIILSLIGLIQSSLLGINLNSPREEISKVFIKICIGLPLIFVGMNITLKTTKIHTYLMIIGTMLSLMAAAMLYTLYVENWYYPLASYVMLIYMSGILLLIGVLFANTRKTEIEIRDLKEELVDLSDILILETEKKDKSDDKSDDKLDDKPDDKPDNKPDAKFLTLRGKLNLYVKKIQELQDDTQSIQRDFEDYGLHTREERRAHDKFIDKLLQIIDACEPFLEPKIYEKSDIGDIGDKAIKRIRSIYSRLQDILVDEGISTIKVVVGNNFDPYRHEIANIENLSENIVIKKEIRKGYICGPIIIRKTLVDVENS